MKKLIPIAAIALFMASCSGDKGSVTIQLPSGFQEKTLVVTHIMIDNIYNAKQQEDLKEVYDTLEVKNGVATLRLDPAGAAYYNIEPPTLSSMQPEFYASPEDVLKVDIRSFDPLDFSVSGSSLMEDITEVTALTRPIQQEYINMVMSDDSASEEQLKEINDRYDNAIKKFVADNPNSHAVPFIIRELSGDDFKVLYDKMTPEAKKSILMPFAELYNQEVEKMLQMRADEDARKAEVASGKLEAPGFTLPDLAGKMVSLSDFRGKWVVLDFWGSWCGWCIKGFPALKEAYQKYGDRLVVIGIDCNETEEEWREGVKKHDLPWLNVYNGHDGALYEAYGITGFPTKAIINPEGRLVDLTTGEDPSFFTRLADFMK